MFIHKLCRITFWMENLSAHTKLKPPLCKGRWHGVSRDGGIVFAIILNDLQIGSFAIQSLSRHRYA